MGRINKTRKLINIKPTPASRYVELYELSSGGRAVRATVGISPRRNAKCAAVQLKEPDIFRADVVLGLAVCPQADSLASQTPFSRVNQPIRQTPPSPLFLLAVAPLPQELARSP